MRNNAIEFKTLPKPFKIEAISIETTNAQIAIVILKAAFIKISFVFSFLLLMIFSSCENDIKEVNNLTQKENYPTEAVKELEVIYSDSAKVKSKITAPELLRYFNTKKPYTELPKGVKMEFYDDALNVNSTLTADYARRDEVTKVMEAKRHVVVINSKGEELKTEQLSWDEKSGEFTSNAFVTITKAEQIIMGDGLKANSDFSNYIITKVSGVISIDKSKKETTTTPINNPAK